MILPGHENDTPMLRFSYLIPETKGLDKMNNIRKRILALLTAVCCAQITCALPQEHSLAAEAVSELRSADADDISMTWNLDEETGLLRVTGSGPMPDYSKRQNMQSKKQTHLEG